MHNPSNWQLSSCLSGEYKLLVCLIINGVLSFIKYNNCISNSWIFTFIHGNNYSQMRKKIPYI